MGKKSGGGTQTVVEKNDPPAFAAPHLANLFSQAGGWFDSGQGRGTFPGQVMAGTPWNLAHSMNMTRDMATRGVGTQGLEQARWTAEDIANSNYAGRNPVMTGQMTRENAYANGSMTEQNPYMRSMVDAATRNTREDFMESIAPALASQFSAAGRTGSGAHVNAFGAASDRLAQRLGDVNANMYGQAYENAQQRRFAAYEAERGGQRSMWAQDPQTRMQASALLPAIGQARYLDADRLAQAGALERDIEQERIDREQDRWREGRDQPLQRLMAYSSILQGATPYMSSTQSSNNATKYNRYSGALGGALGGAALAKALPAAWGISGPMGALAGGLMGLFG